MTRWIKVADVGAIDVEDVMRFDHDGRTFAVYRSEDDSYHASDGLCTHEQVHLSGGFVIGSVIECPRHQGRFDIRTGKALGAPVCIDLRTYPVKVEGGVILIGLS